jgi:hypothetical protein
MIISRPSSSSIRIVTEPLIMKNRVSEAFPGADDVAAWPDSVALAMSQKLVEVLDLGYGGNSNHGCIPKRLHGGLIWYFI